ncbi:hypothetical protein LBMAG42_16190 [Deltaproteobacteria bacterium]|nr:hypothetical protein LBMAG42_16190 [Deltaproteobacteria bacterium]
MRWIFLATLVACDSEPAAPSPEPAPTVVDPAPASTPAPTPAAASTHPDAPRVPARSKDRLAARHILVAYAQAMKAKPEIVRTREEARARAATLREEALAPGANFAALAKKNSDDPTASRGGDLGSFAPGKMVKAFEDAVAAVQVGEVTPVVETPFGFHVILREEVVEVHCAQLMVGFAGAERALPGATRSKDDARKRIEAAKADLAEGKPWEGVVRAYHDGPTKEDGGDLGWFARRQLMPTLDEAAFDLDIGATSDVIESPAAFHLLRRLE